MFDFAQARKFMVEGQIRTNEITDPGIVAAMSELGRERFVPESWKTLAYADRDIPAAGPGQPGADRFLLSPMVLGKIIRSAEIQPREYVLHIGCTRGYGTAILARLANSVVALEQEEALAKAAADNLAALDLGNVAVVTGPLAMGYPSEGPYDAIVIEGAVETLPESLSDQLKEGGRLVVVMGAGRTGQGTVFRRTAKGFSGYPLFDAAAPVLPGFTRAPAFVF
jgi:protein-L-isoaspartate(D-aspartate) O-methyltransferase